MLPIVIVGLLEGYNKAPNIPQAMLQHNEMIGLF
jgi:hypothetical protein